MKEATSGRKAIQSRSPVLIFWSPVALGPPISGDKINEIERIKVLARKFTVYGFVLISIRDLGKSKRYLKEWFGDTNPGIRALPHVPVYGLLVFSTMACAMVVALTVFLRRIFAARIDLVICRGSIQSLPLIVTCRVMRVKVLYNAASVPFIHREMRLTWSNRLQNRFTRYFMRSLDYFALRNADHVAVSTEKSVSDLVKWFGAGSREKVVLLPMPIPDALFASTPRFSVSDEIELVYNGSINRLYDFTHLIQAINNLNDKGRKVTLTIYAPLEKRHLVNKNVHVRFRGQLPRDEILQIIKRATAGRGSVERRDPRCFDKSS